MLGTGSAFAKAFYNNNALLDFQGAKLLVDCGHTAPRALKELGIGFNEIDAVLITHIHADHIGGLEELAFQSKFFFNRKPVLYISEDLIEPLWQHSLRGGLEQDDCSKIDDYFEIRPLQANVPREVFPGLRVELLLTPHIPGKNSYSILFNDYFFYTSDMVFNRELLERLVRERGVAVIFHDCQLHPPGTVHADLNSLLTLPEELQQRIYLMHYGDDQPQFVGKTGRMKFVEQHKVYKIDKDQVVLVDTNSVQ
jgi:glyoxylase-like metal-dependent hydrolase (beta-lactamase superfamily II)